MRAWKFIAAMLVAASAAAAVSAFAAVPAAGPHAAPARAGEAGFPSSLVEIAAARPATPESVALGKKLFFEGRLSSDGTVACATCHDPEKGFTDHLPTSKGVGGKTGKRNSPTVLNAMFYESQFWDGRAPSLEDQAKLPILNPIEMGRKNGDEVVAAVAAIPEYRDAFQKLNGRAPTYDDIAAAIADYERAQSAFDAPFDRFLQGDDKALSASARRGWTVFNGRGRCMTCHGVNQTQPLFIDNKFHNIGVAAHKQDFADLAKKGLGAAQKGDRDEIDRLALETDLSELGRFLVTVNAADIGAFKTSGLRNLLVTQPYFHDGSADTLWDVIDHYNKGGVQNPFLDGGIQRLDLSEGEIDDLVAFLGSLTSSRYQALADAELARQRAAKATKRPSRDVAAASGTAALNLGLKGPFGDVLPKPASKDPARIGGR